MVLNLERPEKSQVHSENHRNINVPVQQLVRSDMNMLLVTAPNSIYCEYVNIPCSLCITKEICLKLYCLLHFNYRTKQQ